MLVAIFSLSLLEQGKNKENRQVLVKEPLLTGFPNMLTFLLECVSFVRCYQGLIFLHHCFPKCGPRNAFWQPVKDHIAKCILTSRAKGSVLSNPNVSQGLCTAESWTAAWDWFSAHSRWISALLRLIGFG